MQAQPQAQAQPQPQPQPAFPDVHTQLGHQPAYQAYAQPPQPAAQLPPAAQAIYNQAPTPQYTPQTSHVPNTGPVAGYGQNYGQNYGQAVIGQNTGLQPGYEQSASQPPQSLGGYGQEAHAGPGFTRETAAPSGISPRIHFIRLVYLHLTLAIFAFTGFSFLLRNNETIYKLISFPIIKFAILGSSYNWAIFLLLFVAVGWVADKWAQRRGSKAIQYMGLGLYVLAEAIIFLPLLYVAELKGAKIMA
ncbi:MAG: US12 family protein, partial [Kofleriaceae bacterium]|nr:US12 family protein [Kofleriaceae bacterium]